MTMPVPDPPGRILLVRLSAIGDILFASPLIAAFRRAYPQARIAWLTQPEYRSLLEHHPDLDQVIDWPLRDWRTLWRARRLRTLAREIGALRGRLLGEGFDLAVDLQGLLKSAVPTYLTAAGERIGLGSREGGRWLMTRVVPRGGDPERIGSEYLHLAATLGLPLQDFAMALHYGPEEAAFAAELVAREGLTAGFAVLCPFTTRPQKHWREERWGLLAERIPNELGLATVLLGGPGDRPAAGRIGRLAARPPLDLAGQTSLLQAAALIDRSALLIGVDTGLGHMGIAFGRPSLLLFGSTCPYRDTTRANARVLYHRLDCSPCKRRPTCQGAFTCMGAIQVNEVLGAAREVMAATPPGPGPAAARPGG